VGKLKTRVGKRKIFFGALRRILPTLAWNPAGAPGSAAGSVEATVSIEYTTHSTLPYVINTD